LRNQSIKKFDLTGKTAIVTGGAGILGRGYARTLKENGANVIILDIDKLLIEKANLYFQEDLNIKNIDIFLCNVSQETEIKKVLEKILKKYKAVDILINNAATKTDNLDNFFDAFENYKLSTWNDVMSGNLNSMFLMNKIIGKQMVDNKIKGSIVQVSSIYGLVGPDQRIYEGSIYENRKINTPAVYSVSKAAVIGFSKYLATYWGKFGIRVNSITPGGVESGQNDEFKQKYSKRVPLNRMGKSDEMENIILYLSSDASSYVTGQNFIIDGGLSCW